jgi:sulfur-oxidizing protein SoxY
MQRRNFLQVCLGITALVLLPLRALAAAWNKSAFESKTLDGALQGLNVATLEPSGDIEITAPAYAENGAVVQVEITSRIADTESIFILAEKNPTPLIAHFTFSNGAEPFVVTRIKMAETADVVALVKAGDRYYKASRKVEVSENGCG